MAMKLVHRKVARNYFANSFHSVFSCLRMCTGRVVCKFWEIVDSSELILWCIWTRLCCHQSIIKEKVVMLFREAILSRESDIYLVKVCEIKAK